MSLKRSRWLAFGCKIEVTTGWFEMLTVNCGFCVVVLPHLPPSPPAPLAPPGKRGAEQPYVAVYPWADFLKHDGLGNTFRHLAVIGLFCFADS